MFEGGTTPGAITDTIRQLCNQLVPNIPPRYLPVTPVTGAEPQDCFEVVAQHVRNNGGRICYGWQIWEWPNVMLEAEFHAVWEDRDGKLHDLTPKLSLVERVLFLPDATRVYNGRPVKSVLHVLSPSPAIESFIDACDAEFELMNRGDRAEQHGEIILSGAEVSEYETIQRQKLLAYMQITGHSDLLPPPRNVLDAVKAGRNDPCPCGSGKKVKKCHRELAM
ncbi:MAG TPA: SEC-C metal-binding domain-containing protein [Longimicrobium sp.]|jgi:hypothetical protein|uniref:SEC-C metal-binding domain-containing protein n=1 Tax=Longimicrobium sp. TaxID=2029185 RepID=UPI002ED9E74D